MVIGNGLLAKAFVRQYAEDSSVVIFASGVANSRETRVSEFDRETRLLREKLTSSGRFVYFSTCSVADSNAAETAYVVHKKAMEKLVLARADSLVVRLPQVVGRTENRSTLANFLRDRIMADEAFDLHSKAIRNLIDVDDVSRIVSGILGQPKVSGVMNVAAPKGHSMPEIVAVFERVLGRSARARCLESGSAYEIDTQLCEEVAAENGVHFDNTYLERIVRKYYVVNTGN